MSAAACIFCASVYDALTCRMVPFSTAFFRAALSKFGLKSRSERSILIHLVMDGTAAVPSASSASTAALWYAMRLAVTVGYRYRRSEASARRPEDPGLANWLARKVPKAIFGCWPHGHTIDPPPCVTRSVRCRSEATDRVYCTDTFLDVLEPPRIRHRPGSGHGAKRA